MSDLQIGLALLGVLLVTAVLGFNWWQERQFRRRAEDAFGGRQQGDDFLNRPARHESPGTQAAPANSNMADIARIEPRMEPAADPGQMVDMAASNVIAHGAAADTAILPASNSGQRIASDLPLPEIDYLVEIRTDALIAPEKLHRIEADLRSLNRRITFGGFNAESGSWEPMLPDGAGYSSVSVALQLVNRTGPVTEEQLHAFVEVLTERAGELKADARLPEFGPALDQAAALDEFCADVDVQVGISVIADTGQVFHGSKIRALAESAGLKLHPTGVFQLCDEKGGLQFSLDNQDAEPFQVERIRYLTTTGITFLLDVPRVANGLRVFDKMVEMSRSFASSLDGTLADDNRALLNDAGFERIRVQLRAIYASMQQRGIEAGSALALRLFS